MLKRTPLLGGKVAPMRICLLLLCMFLAAPAWAEPIHQLVRDNELDQVAELLEAEKLSGPKDGVEPLLTRRVDGATPLLVAAFVGNAKMCDLLLSYGASLEEADLLGDTALFRAFSEDHEVLALDLVARGADLNKANKVGETPFMMAARSTEATTFKKVLAGNGEMEAVDSRGRTALHHAVEKDNRENIVLLLAAGANVNVADKKGSTVLHKATAMGDTELVTLLLDAGADRQAKDGRGRDAARIATERQDAPMLRTLTAEPAAKKPAGKSGKS